jgi:hypothetical protein
VTVTGIVPVILPELAIITVVPGAFPVTSPPALMLAITGSEELHMTELVRIWTLPSLKLPVAVN